MITGTSSWGGGGVNKPINIVSALRRGGCLPLFWQWTGAAHMAHRVDVRCVTENSERVAQAAGWSPSECPLDAHWTVYTVWCNQSSRVDMGVSWTQRWMCCTRCPVGRPIIHTGRENSLRKWYERAHMHWWGELVCRRDRNLEWVGSSCEWGHCLGGTKMQPLGDMFDPKNNVDTSSSYYISSIKRVDRCDHVEQCRNGRDGAAKAWKRVWTCVQATEAVRDRLQPSCTDASSRDTTGTWQIMLRTMQGRRQTDQKWLEPAERSWNHMNALRAHLSQMCQAFREQAKHVGRNKYWTQLLSWKNLEQHAHYYEALHY